MNIEEYLTAYESYRDTVLGLKNAVERMSDGQDGRLLPVGKMIDFVDYEELEKEYVKKKRILSHATKKLQRAISRIRDPKVSNYLICKYLCCMKNEDFAASFNYCERQVYRIASNAKKQLAELMKPEVPLPRRVRERQQFRFSPKSTRTSLRKHGPRSRRRR